MLRTSSKLSLTWLWPGKKLLEMGSWGRMTQSRDKLCFTFSSKSILSAARLSELSWNSSSSAVGSFSEGLGRKGSRSRIAAGLARKFAASLCFFKSYNKHRKVKVGRKISSLFTRKDRRRLSAVRDGRVLNLFLRRCSVWLVRKDRKYPTLMKLNSKYQGWCWYSIVGIDSSIELFFHVPFNGFKQFYIQRVTR